MATNRRPFDGNDAGAIIYSILNKDPIPITDFRADTPHTLQAIINRCLQREPDQRYQTITELLNDLEQEILRVGDFSESEISFNLSDHFPDSDFFNKKLETDPEISLDKIDTEDLVDASITNGPELTETIEDRSELDSEQIDISHLELSPVEVTEEEINSNPPDLSHLLHKEEDLPSNSFTETLPEKTTTEGPLILDEPHSNDDSVSLVPASSFDDSVYEVPPNSEDQSEILDDISVSMNQLPLDSESIMEVNFKESIHLQIIDYREVEKNAARFRRIIQRKDGRIVIEEPDRILCYFDYPIDALECAFQLQKLINPYGPLERVYREAKPQIAIFSLPGQQNHLSKDEIAQIAASIVSHTPGGSVVLSENIFKDLGKRRGYRFMPLPPVRVNKNGSAINLFAVRKKTAPQSEVYAPQISDLQPSSKLMILSVTVGLFALLSIVGISGWFSSNPTPITQNQQINPPVTAMNTTPASTTPVDTTRIERAISPKELLGSGAAQKFVDEVSRLKKPAELEAYLNNEMKRGALKYGMKENYYSL